MRAKDFLSERSIELDEGGASGGIRYNTELGVLVAFAGLTVGKTNPTLAGFNKGQYDKALGDPASVHDQVKTHLTKEVYDKSFFNTWIEIGKTIYKRVSADITNTGRGSIPKKFGWVGGSNIGPVADIEFIDNRLTGISLKAESGITLSNLSPKHLGLVGEKGVDIVQFYSQLEGDQNAFVNLKKKCMDSVMKEAQATPGEAVGYKSSGRTITYNQESNTYNIIGKGGREHNNLPAEKILDGAIKNAEWQRVFGDWFIQNFHGGDGTVKKLMKPVATAVSKSFTAKIQEHLATSENLKKVLQIEDQPYYYANDKHLYYVPEYHPNMLTAKEVTYKNAEGTGQLWQLTVGRVEAEPEDCATLEIYIRWRNGMFESNATASAQNLRNPLGMAWVEVD